MPEDIEEQIAMADEGLIVETSWGRKWCSKRGSSIPMRIATEA
jgi:hypothetical protein